jgi:hypothetical protein
VRRVIHANCFPPAHLNGDVLLTDESLVAAAAATDLRVARAEDHIDHDLAHAISMTMARAAFDWFRVGTEDPTMVGGISAGDLSGAEATHAVLMPAARGALAMASALDSGLDPATLVSVVPAGTGRYARTETLAADAAMAAARVRLGAAVTTERIVSGDRRNGLLLDKYAFVRDPDYLVQTNTRRKLARAMAVGSINAQARLRRRHRQGLLILEYNPSRSFARAYSRRAERRWRLICWPSTPNDFLAIARAGDQALLPFTPNLDDREPCGVEQRLRDLGGTLNGSSLCVAGVDLWPIVREPLFAMVERHGRYAAALADKLGRTLERRAVHAVLVPFDTAAPARLIVRVAQSANISTFVINDGFKADNIQQEGMTADIALAWSTAMRDCYYSRRLNGAIVTGNPRSERLSRHAPRGHQVQRVLVGGHTFSPIDLNCRRSDAERFLDEVLTGISAAIGYVSTKVLAKLHPADTPGYYQAILARHSRLAVELRTRGDVIALFDECDVYVTTYSTSLLEAAAIGLPIIYYRVNRQSLSAPFSDDEFLARRSVTSPAQLATLLADRDELATSPPNGWVERYLGPSAGAVDRILAAIEQHAGIECASET